MGKAPELVSISFDNCKVTHATIRCPGCDGIGRIDPDQYYGRVSIQCGSCDYHETHNLYKYQVERGEA